MMESNCELKLTNMKTQSTQPRKEKFNDSFFIRKQMHDPIADNDKQRSIQQTNAIHNNNTSNLTISAKAGNDGAVITTGIENPQKNSFMKTFLRRPFVIAIAVVIANLFLSEKVSAQTLTQTFATSASWTCPPGVNSIIVECWGGGGAGGGATGAPAAGGGGAGGSYVKNSCY